MRYSQLRAFHFVALKGGFSRAAAAMHVTQPGVSEQVRKLEQDYDVPHGISMIGANTSELLIMPGSTETFVWEPKQVGVWPFYCTDFCSALHQEMQGYVRVSPANAKIEISYTIDGDKPGAE